MTLERETILKGRYRIEEILGQGGMGSVYRAIDENLGVLVAVKENLFSTEEYNRQFRREAIILASMKQQNLPKVSDHFEIEGQGQYFVMEYIEGEDLRQRMDRLGILPDEEVIIIGAAICDALQYLHTRTPPVLHRDIKPGNIKIDPDGSIFLVDFGLAKIVQGTEATTTGARAMTPGYSSPEQYGTARTDTRSDVYSLGATLYAAITGTIPEDGLARAMEQADLTPPRKRNPKVSRRLAGVIEKALAVHPNDRYQSAQEMKVALQKASASTLQIGASNEITVVPPPPLETPTTVIKEDSDEVPSLKLKPPLSNESTSRRRRIQIQKYARILGISVAAVFIIGAAWFTFSGIGNRNTENIEATEIFGVGVDEVATNTPTLNPDISPTESSIEPSETPQSLSSPTPFAFGTQIATATEVPIILGDEAEFNYELAFVSDRSGTNQIWLMGLDGSEPSQLTNIEGGACQPTWSPDGMKLVFISPCEDNYRVYVDSELYLLDLTLNEHFLLFSGKGLFDPAWSPDGKYLLFVSVVDSFIQSQIYRYTFDTGELNVMVGAVEDIRLFIDPSWSPDGRRIVYVVNQRLAVIDNIPGAEPKLLTRSGDFTNTKPVWHSDGDIIFFMQSPLGKTRVPLIMRVDIEMLTILDPFDYVENRLAAKEFILAEIDPSISFDGVLLAFESWPEDGVNHDIYVMFSDGSQRFRLTGYEGADFQPAFRPIVGND